VQIIRIQFARYATPAHRCVEPGLILSRITQIEAIKPKGLSEVLVEEVVNLGKELV
jgi:hypothetical protein